MGMSVLAEGTYSSKIEEIDAFLTENVPKTAFPSMSVTIVDKDDVLMSKSYGTPGLEKTTYVLGSVSKSFTALCIMQLAEQGKLSLSDPLSKYLPSVTDGSKITILQLLNHTSGLGEHQNTGNCHIVGAQGEHVYANVNYSLLFISGIARVLFRIKKMAAEKTLNKECNFFGR